MNSRTYTIPGLKGWIFKTSTTGCGLWFGNKDREIKVTSAMSTEEIAERVKEVFWFTLRATREATDEAIKTILRVDWQAIISEAGSSVQHQSNELPGWTLKISTEGSGLWHSSGSSVPITADTSMREIKEGVRRVLKDNSTLAETEEAVRVIMQVDFRSLILNAWNPRFAPLIADFKVDNTALIESICNDVKLLALLQKADTSLADEICALVKKLD